MRVRRRIRTQLSGIVHEVIPFFYPSRPPCLVASESPIRSASWYPVSWLASSTFEPHRTPPVSHPIRPADASDGHRVLLRDARLGSPVSHLARSRE